MYNKIKERWFLVSLLLISMLLSACGGGGGSSPEQENTGDTATPMTFKEYTQDMDEDPVDVDVIVEGEDTSTLSPATKAIHGYKTVIVDENSSFNFDKGSDGTSLIITGSPLPQLSPGDIIAGVSSDGESGFLRKVVSQSGTTVITERATLEEAFPNAELSLNMSFGNESVARSASNTRVTVSGNANILNVDRHIEHLLADGIKTVVDIGINSEFNVSLDISILSARIDRFSTIVEANYSSASYLDIDLQYEYSRQFNKNFNPIFNKNKIIVVGGIPVLLNVKVVPIVGASVAFSSAGSLRYGYNVAGDVSAGFRYINPSFSKVASFTPSFQKIGPEYTLDGGANTQARASLAVIVSLYETTIDIPVIGKFEIDGPGVGIDLGAYAKFDVTSNYDSQAEPSVTCLLDLTVGLSSELDIDYGSIGETLGVDNPGPINVYENARSLWSSSECPFEGEVGHLQGTVTDLDGVAISNVQISILDASERTVESTETDTLGQYFVSDLVAGSYQVEFLKEGYETAYSSVEVLDNLTVTVAKVLVMGEQEDGASGVLRLFIADAQDPSISITGAQIKVREGLNSPSGNYVTRFYSADTSTDFSLMAGYYTLEISKEGYNTIYESVSIVGNQTHAVSAYMSLDSVIPGLGGEARMVLTWGQNPRDLDSHIENSVAHVYYGNSNSSGISLDVDDTSSYGPETITINDVDISDSYSYYVHHYAGSGTIGTSGASVKLFYEGTVRTYNAPPGSGQYWRVFSIENGQISPCNTGCISGSSSSLSVRALQRDEETWPKKSYTKDKHFN